MNPRGPGRNRGQDDLRRRDGEIAAMVFADAEEVEADLIRERAFVDDVPQGFGLRQLPAVGRNRNVAEGIYPKLNRARHVLIVSRRRVNRPR